MNRTVVRVRFFDFEFARNPFDPSVKVQNINNPRHACQIRLDITFPNEQNDT